MHRWGLGFLSPYRAGLAGRHRKRLPRSPASLTCSCPLQLSPAGQSDGPEVSLRTSLDCAKDSAPRPAAHPFKASGSPPIPTLRMFSDLMRNVFSGLVPHAPYCRLTGSAEALRPAAALSAALVGRGSHGYYGLSDPLLALVISRPTTGGASKRFRRCSRRKFCAALGLLWTP